MPQFGLIGKTLSHSFSQTFFTDKFEQLGLSGYTYELFELDDINRLTELVSKPDLKGLNVTIPYKESVIPFLHELDEKAEAIGAVNTIRVRSDGKLIGFNTDYIGFKESLLHFIPNTDMKTLVLGTGGASKAVCAVLSDLGVFHQVVSRTGGLMYDKLTPDTINDHKLLINCTPVGTYPNVNDELTLPFEAVGTDHYLFDLIYNPEEPSFLKRGKERGAHIKNGLEMLHLQAEAAWKIWNS